MKYALPLVAGLCVALGATPSGAEQPCPTAADLEIGLKLETNPAGKFLGSVATFRKLPLSSTEASGYPSDPRVDDYIFADSAPVFPDSEIGRGPVGWHATIKYRGLLTILNMTDGAFVFFWYPNGWDDVFPLEEGAQRELDVVLKTAQDVEGWTPGMPGRLEEKARMSIEAVDETKVLIGPCTFDALIIETTLKFETEGEDQEDSVSMDLYVPALGVSVTRPRYDTFGPVPESERQ